MPRHRTCRHCSSGPAVFNNTGTRVDVEGSKPLTLTISGVITCLDGGWTPSFFYFIFSRCHYLFSSSFHRMMISLLLLLFFPSFVRMCFFNHPEMLRDAFVSFLEGAQPGWGLIHDLLLPLLPFGHDQNTQTPLSLSSLLRFLSSRSTSAAALALFRSRSAAAWRFFLKGKNKRSCFVFFFSSARTLFFLLPTPLYTILPFFMIGINVLTRGGCIMLLVDGRIIIR